jgi:dolichol-phosphate mannosyltransferase
VGIGVSVILPTYCERENIGRLITAIEDGLLDAGWEVEILVVDDNSPDCTAQAVEELQPRQGAIVKCIVRTKERGLATAIKCGLLEANGDRIVVMDTDFNHSPENLPEMVRQLDDYDLVIGSRFVKGGGMEERRRYWFSLLYNLLIQIILFQGIRDSLSGFFAIRRAQLFTLDLDAIFYGYGEYFIRLTYLTRQRGFKILEVPVFYTLRKYGFSKSNLLSMIYNYTRCALELRFKKV